MRESIQQDAALSPLQEASKRLSYAFSMFLVHDGSGDGGWLPVITGDVWIVKGLVTLGPR